jgi:hypothetical protein
MYRKIITFWSQYLEICFLPSDASITTESHNAERGYLLSLFINNNQGKGRELRFNVDKTISVYDIDEKLIETLDHFEYIDTWLEKNTNFKKEEI